MELKKFTIGKKSMDFSALINFTNNEGKEAKEMRNVSAYEEPLPALGSAFADLRQVLASSWDIPDAENYSDRVTVHGITISHTKAGTRSVIIRGKVQLDSRKDYLHPFISPMMQIDKPADGESGDVEVRDPKHLKAIFKAIKEAEGYADGSKRSQKLLDFSEAKAALQATADKGQDMFAGANA